MFKRTLLAATAAFAITTGVHAADIVDTVVEAGTFQT
jgi:opacity protein-like surface antigen